MGWEVPKIWPGATVFVVGGGPSLASVDLEQLRGRRVIGINNAYKLMPWMDALYFMDCIWYEWHKATLLDFKGLKITVCTRIKDDPSIRTLQRGEKYGLDQRPGYLSTGSNSGYGGIALAVKLGGTQIVLLGFDMKVVDGKFNYHDEHKRELNSDIYENIYLRTFNKLPAVASYHGIQIYNATEDSALEVFPKRPLRQFL